MSEHDTQSMFFEAALYLKHPAIRWMHAIPNGGARHISTAVKMRQEGVRAGIWDVCLPFPSNGYHGLYLEFKHGRNKLTPEQREFGDYLEQHGYKTGVAYTVDEALEILKTYLQLPPDVINLS